MKNYKMLYYLSMLFIVIVGGCGKVTIQKQVPPVKYRYRIEEKIIYIPITPQRLVIKKPLTGEVLFSKSIKPENMEILKESLDNLNILAYEKLVRIFPEKTEAARKYIKSKMTVSEGLLYMKFYKNTSKNAKLFTYVKEETKNKLTNRCKQQDTTACNLLNIFFSKDR